MNAEVRKLESLLSRIQTNRAKPRAGLQPAVAAAPMYDEADHPPFAADAVSASESTLVEESLDISVTSMVTGTGNWTDATEATGRPAHDAGDPELTTSDYDGESDPFELDIAAPVAAAPDSLFPESEPTGPVFRPASTPPAEPAIVPVPLTLSAPRLPTQPIAVAVGNTDVRGPRTFGEWVRRSLGLRVR